ncbi:MAG: hypothetical protein QW038_01290 [Nanopusillaceae archaeon]
MISNLLLNLFKDLDEEMKKANIKEDLLSYVKKSEKYIFLTAISMGFSGFILGNLLSLIILRTLVIFIPLIISIFFSIIGFLIGVVFFRSLPSIKAAERKRKIDSSIYFATIYMAALSSSGVNPLTLFELLAKYKEFSEIEKDAKEIYDLNFEETFKIYYLMFSDSLKGFSQNLEKLELVSLDINNQECIMFFYPFPNIEDINYYDYNYVNFFIYNIDGELCENFAVSKDWKIIRIDKIPNSRNISLYLKDSLNLSQLDPYSLFIFDSLENEISIESIAYNNEYINISNILYNPLVHVLPIYITIRIKENDKIKNLEYLSRRYNILESLVGDITSFSILDSNWLTIYLNDACYLKKTIVIRYSILPSNKFKFRIFSNLNKERCNGNYTVSYYKNKFFEKYNILKLLNLKLSENPTNTEYENELYLINGLNLAILKIYGS